MKHFAPTTSVLLLLAAGCVTTMTYTPPVPWDASRVSDLSRHARDPRMMWLTVYSSDQGPQFQGANRLHEGQGAELSFKSKDRTTLPVVFTGSITDDRIPTLLDTSAQDCWASGSAAAQLGCVALGPPLFKQQAYHLEDDIPGYLCHVSTLKLDKLHVESVLVLLRAADGPLGALDRDPEHHQAVAVLGYPFLRNFAFVQFDFPSRKIRMTSTDAYRAQPNRVLARAPIREVRGALATEGRVDGQRTLVILDSAGDFDLSIPGRPPGTVEQLELGDMVFRQVALEPGEPMRTGDAVFPRVGRGLLDHYRITLDHKTNEILFEKPAKVD